jgi:hypothetical protein
MQRPTTAALVALAVAFSAAGALAEPPHPPPGKSQATPPGKAGQGREEAKEKAKDARNSFREKFGGASDAGVPAARANVAQAWAKLKETRAERRRQRLAEIKQKWGAIEDKPAARAEFKVHAWRLARLQRIRALAEADGKTDVVARVDKLIQKENDRHEKHMAVLQKDGGDK